jgi:hypothetical protein
MLYHPGRIEDAIFRPGLESLRTLSKNGASNVRLALGEQAPADICRSEPVLANVMVNDRPRGIDALKSTARQLIAKVRFFIREQ